MRLEVKSFNVRNRRIEFNLWNVCLRYNNLRRNRLSSEPFGIPIDDYASQAATSGAAGV